MALIKCPECGKEISNLASQCPHCGCPASEWQNTENKEDVILEVPVETTNETTDSPQKPQHNNGTETAARIICAIFAIIAIIAVIQINKKPKPKSNKETTEQIQANRVQDSIRRVEAERLMQERLHKQHVQDSIQAAEKQKAIRRLKPLFREKKDEFNECVWVTPSSAPRYRNYNATYCYFCKNWFFPSSKRCFAYILRWLWCDNF